MTLSRQCFAKCTSDESIRPGDKNAVHVDTCQSKWASGSQPFHR
jgi:hypothetical protein